MKFLVMLCVAAGFAYCGYLGVLYVRQDSLVFPGRTTDTARVAEIRKYYKGLEDFEVKAPDGTRLRGYLLVRTRDGKPAPAILYFHGNAEEQSGFFLWSPSELSGFTVAGLNYRGYGTSEGKPSETALKADALTVYDALAARLGPACPSWSWAASLGSGIAAYVAAPPRRGRGDPGHALRLARGRGPGRPPLRAGVAAHAPPLRRGAGTRPGSRRPRSCSWPGPIPSSRRAMPARLAALWGRSPRKSAPWTTPPHGNIIDNPPYWKQYQGVFGPAFRETGYGQLGRREEASGGQEGGSPPSWTTPKGGRTNSPPASLQTGREKPFAGGPGG